MGLQALAAWSAHVSIDVLYSIVSVAQVIVLIALVVRLLRIQDHVIARSTVGPVLALWIGFMTYVAWEFFTQVD